MNPKDGVRVAAAQPDHLMLAHALLMEEQAIFGVQPWWRALAQAQKRGQVLVVLHQQVVLGVAHFYAQRRVPLTTLYQCCIQSGWRGQGLGRSLVEAVLTQARAQGQEAVLLKCPAHLAANGFWGHLGFTCTESLAGVPYPLLVWRYQLAASETNGTLWDLVS